MLTAGLVVAVLAGAAGGAGAGAGERRFDAAAAWQVLRDQVALGPRPAGSPAERRLASYLRARLPAGRYEPVPHGLRNVVGLVRGRDPSRFIVVGAHYDTKDLPGFVGADDGASGVAVVLQLARTLRPRALRPSVVFVFFDGEESPRGTPDAQFVARGLRGSRVAARRFRGAEAMILLDMIGDRRLSIPREESSDPQLWRLLRASARAVGSGAVFPPGTIPVVWDDHTPFERVGVPSVDLIDFRFACWHRRCDNMSAVSEQSLARVGSTVLELLRRLS